ncbi:hypothetical protein DXG01_000032 [Tephrocybe rancida]|nr:hypothetical protein DXG01_000032 [Tephrocybe rancida]
MNAPNDKPTPTTDASNETVSYTRPLVASHLSATDSGRAHLSPPQHVRLDAKEMQRQRLVRLFKIPEFFAVVREGWGDALKEESEEKQASASASSSIKEPKHLDDSSNTN